MPHEADTTIEIANSYPVQREGLDITAQVNFVEIKDSLITGEFTWVIEILANQINSEEETFFDNGFLALRLSQNRGDIEQTTGWRTGLVESADVYYRGETPIVHIRGRGLSLKLQEHTRWRSFIKKPISSVLHTILDPYGINFRIPAIPQRGTWYQLGMTDWDFLHYLTTELLAGTGQRAIWLQLFNNTLILRTLDYGAPISRSYGIGGRDDRTVEIKFTHFGRQVDYQGGGEYHLYGFDIQDKRTIIGIPSPSLLPALADRIVRPYAGSRRYFCTTLQDQLAVNRAAMARWTKITSKYFGFQAALVGDPGLTLGDIVYVQAVDVDGEVSSMGGKYPVYEIIHRYQPGYRLAQNQMSGPDMTTFIAGYRRACQFGDDAAEGAARLTTVNFDSYLDEDADIQGEPVEMASEELP